MGKSGERCLREALEVKWSNQKAVVRNEPNAAIGRCARFDEIHWIGSEITAEMMACGGRARAFGFLGDGGSGITIQVLLGMWLTHRKTPTHADCGVVIDR